MRGLLHVGDGSEPAGSGLFEYGLGAGLFAGAKRLVGGLAGRLAAIGGAEAVGAEAGSFAGPVGIGVGVLGGFIAEKVISGLHKSSSGNGQGASVSGPSTGGVNLAAGNAVVGIALTQQGVPYSWGGGSNSGPTVGFGSGRDTQGFDCSSFTRFVMSKVGVVIPRTSQEQQQVGKQINPKDAQPGDLLFWGRPAHHVAIYMGKGMMIEAPHTGDVVKRTGVDLNSVTSCSRVLNHKTGTTGINNIMHAAGGYQGVANYGLGATDALKSQASVNYLRGSSASEAMSGGTSSSSGLGFGDSSSPYSGSSTSGMTKQYLTINPQSGRLETSNNASGTVINYGGVTVKVDVPHGAQVTAQDLSKAIKAELKSLPVSVRVAST